MWQDLLLILKCSKTQTNIIIKSVDYGCNRSRRERRIKETSRKRDCNGDHRIATDRENEKSKIRLNLKIENTINCNSIYDRATSLSYQSPEATAIKSCNNINAICKSLNKQPEYCIDWFLVTKSEKSALEEKANAKHYREKAYKKKENTWSTRQPEIQQGYTEQSCWTTMMNSRGSGRGYAWGGRGRGRSSYGGRGRVTFAGQTSTFAKSKSTERELKFSPHQYQGKTQAATYATTKDAIIQHI